MGTMSLYLDQADLGECRERGGGRGSDIGKWTPVLHPLWISTRLWLTDYRVVESGERLPVSGGGVGMGMGIHTRGTCRTTTLVVVGRQAFN